MFKESIIMSWQNIIYNKMRSFLTILGIIIGVSSIIALISIVEGVTMEVTSQFSELGANKLTIQAKGTPLKKGLTDYEVQLLADIDGVNGISPTISTTTSVVGNGQVHDKVTIEGKNASYFKYNQLALKSGRLLNSIDLSQQSNVALVSESLADTLYFGEQPIGQYLLINGISYRIVGVLEKTDQMDMMSSMSGKQSENRVIVPYQNLMGLVGLNCINNVEVYMQNNANVDEIIGKVELILNQAFNYKENSYSIINMEGLLDTIQSMNSMMTMMLVGIASIALLVGGIGIMNMMLVSVTERTMEIGLKKALGAKPRSIQLQFLIESIFLSLFGGVVGLVLGVMIAFVVAFIIGFTPSISTNSIALALLFSGGVGVIFGLAPARKASQLNPIDALRRS
ncbi:ABC transporter permease [Turicibacter sanguinis]|uniref:FtsX-like permease family protein n=3 Tax=Turicibacter sanguinis TaxID=154288 RepID=A0A6G2CLK9_9FIRM|nr:ABC transporter permease [Turicibacter sanguinis]MDB8437765.1 ABC transporter permease [Turicibacter sanguinis]MDB8458680.1 ABC transporter permease [Turicibacter sanguinis]MTK68574.1 FtsX-like permease family protein [Turicibacter sanguinis]MTK79809.1 FtsX-like permease family protein [Turicibacter sanguinis]MTK83544.1 FtsX-like permease family protein [Turicibacter sanguinis]